MSKLASVVLVVGVLIIAGCGSASTPMDQSSSSTVTENLAATSSTLSAHQEAFLKKYNLPAPQGLRPMGSFKIDDLIPLEQGRKGNFDSIVCGYIFPGPEQRDEIVGPEPYHCAILKVSDVYDEEVAKALGTEVSIGIYQEKAQVLKDTSSPIWEKNLYAATREKPSCVKIGFGIPDGIEAVCLGGAAKIEAVNAVSAN